MRISPPPMHDEMNSSLWKQWFSALFRLVIPINTDGSITPAKLNDEDAQNDSIYYSMTQGKIVYKDNAGNINSFY